MVSLRIWVLFPIVTFLGGCVRYAPWGPGHPDPIKQIRERVTDVRDLKFSHEVGVLFANAESIKSRIDTDLQQDLRGRKLEDISLAYAKLGLLPWGVDLRSSLLNFYSSQTWGFYDSRAKKVVLPEKGRKDREDEKILVHELTHGLQDQHFSLGHELRRAVNADAALALRSVAEGDAVLTEYAYSFGRLDEWLPAYVHQVLSNGAEEAVFPGIPAVIGDKVQFQYGAGTRFVLRFVGKNGWAPVNLLYKYPPLSTEQVLHPEKYLESPDPPTRINLGDLSTLFSSEWREIENDTLGELMIQCLFKEFLGAKAAAAVADGWDGDRFVAYQRGEEVAFLWVTVWDSSSDAQEFFDSYHEVLSVKYDVRPSEKDRFYIEKRDNLVLVVEGLEPEDVKSNIETVWLKMEIKEESFQPPPLSFLTGGR